MADGQDLVARPFAPVDLRAIESRAPSRTAPGFFLVYVQGAANVHSLPTMSRAISTRRQLAHANPGRIVWICAPDRGLIVELTEHEVTPEAGGEEP